MNKSNKKFLEKYSRQIIMDQVGIEGQKKISKSSISIIGCGGLGTSAAQYLSMSGINNFTLIDNDYVDITNLNRQTLFSTNDIGKFKVKQAKIKIKKINNKIKIQTFNEKLNFKNAHSIIKNFEIICDGTDNFETRYLINDECKRSKKILISAAISKFEGHLYKFNFKKKSSCYRCFMPEIPLFDNNCQSEGIFSPLAGIMGSMQANEVIKTILNFKNDLNNQMIIFNSIKSNFKNIKLTLNPHCKNRCSK